MGRGGGEKFYFDSDSISANMISKGWRGGGRVGGRLIDDFNDATLARSLRPTPLPLPASLGQARPPLHPPPPRREGGGWGENK